MCCCCVTLHNLVTFNSNRIDCSKKYGFGSGLASVRVSDRFGFGVWGYSKRVPG